MAMLIVSLVLAVVLGFAAHRASICTVRAVGETMSERTFAMFASIGKSVLWIVVVTVPFFWLLPATAAGLSGWPLTGVAIAGGFLFGLGAGINGACAYSTMARLVDGEVGMAPGGNDALVLYGLPSLSPHAIPAFAALALGVVAALVLMRRLFGIETRVVCKDDVYLSDWGLGARKS